MRILPMVLLLACGGKDDDPDPTTSTTPPVVCEGDEDGPTTMIVAPYVQSVTKSGAVVMWETAEGVGSRLEYGPTEALGQAACGERVVFGADVPGPGTELHAVTITGLPAGEAVYYQVRTGGTESAIAHFRTIPDDPESSVRIIAMSDSQQDSNRPEKFGEILNDGVLAYTRANFGEDLSEEIGLVLFPGDLVDNGWLAAEWQQEFFAPAAELFAAVPVYPAIGNHEGGSPHYYRYFHLPEDGDAERTYTTTYANLRIVTLDSNQSFDVEQLLWLDGVLDAACVDPEIDFVFAQLHHPWLSELWIPGNTDFTGEVASKLGAFSTECGKPSIHFFGHTHGYSRGQLQDHDHLMVNVASAGGGLDRWGEQAQIDYDEFSVSQDTYGFVAVEVEAGEDPKFTMSRVSRGTPEAAEDNVVSDQITIWRFNDPPATPLLAPLTCDGDPVLAASAYSDPEGHAHQATHWQVADDCTFGPGLVERWRQDRNEYMGVDSQAGDDLTDEPFAELVAASQVCVRVRYRDEGLRWSAWSDGQIVDVPDCG